MRTTFVYLCTQNGKVSSFILQQTDVFPVESDGLMISDNKTYITVQYIKAIVWTAGYDLSKVLSLLCDTGGSP